MAIPLRDLIMNMSETERSKIPSPPKFTSVSTLLEAMQVTRVEKSPYFLKGPELPIAIWEPEGCYGLIRVRVDMPGVNKVDVVADAYENTISFKGFEEVITMHGIDKGSEVCRVYEGLFDLDPMRFPHLDFAYEFCDGTLVMNIDSYRPGKTVGVTLRPRKTEAGNEVTKESAINPLVSAGLDRHSIYHFTDKSFVFAIDMPGISELDIIKLDQLSDNTTTFYAKDTSNPKGSYYGESMEESRRAFEGCFKLNVQEFDLGKAQFEIIHGVLWIMVPKIIKPPIELLTLFEGPIEKKVYNQP